jgi:hypothetical protein
MAARKAARLAARMAARMAAIRLFDILNLGRKYNSKQSMLSAIKK